MPQSFRHFCSKFIPCKRSQKKKWERECEMWIKWKSIELYRREVIELLFYCSIYEYTTEVLYIRLWMWWPGFGIDLHSFRFCTIDTYTENPFAFVTGSEIWRREKNGTKWLRSIIGNSNRREEKRREFNALDMTRNTKYIAFALQKTTIHIYVIVSNIENVVCSVVIFNGNVIVNMAR